MKLTKEQRNRLIDELNCKSSIITLDEGEYTLKPLKNGTQWLICSEIVKLKEWENGTMQEIMECLSTNLPVVVKVITLALCNEKDLIFKGGIEDGAYSDYFNELYDDLFFNLKTTSLAQILLEIFNKLDISFFYQSSEMVKVMMKMMMKMVEVK